MTSQIDPLKPTTGQALTQDVRDNFGFAHNEISALQATQANQAGDISQNAGDIDALETGQGVQDGRITQNETDIGTNASNIGTNATDIGNNATNIGNNQTDIQTNKDDITERVKIAGDVMTGQLDGITPTDPANLTRRDWVEAAIAAAIGGAGGTLVGSITMWALDTEPAGYLTCNGQAVDRTTFSTLFALLGVIYGPGNGTTTFNLPDYRGQFIRGRDAGAGTDPGAASRTDRGDGTTGDSVGTKQASANLSHTHAAAGAHTHDTIANHQHAATGNHTHANAGNHSHASNGAHQHPATGDHFHEIPRFNSGPSQSPNTYVEEDTDDSESPANIVHKMSTEGNHQHASAGSHSHAAAGDHGHAATGNHQHAGAGGHQHVSDGSHSHAASGGSEARAVNVYVNFIIKT
jgi:microcystin-dependent protein